MLTGLGCPSKCVADKAPDFSARASLAGKEFNFSLQDALKKGPVVVYFYPSAYTPEEAAIALKLIRLRRRKICSLIAAGAYSLLAYPADSIERTRCDFSADVPDYCCRKVSGGLRRRSLKDRQLFTI